MAEAVLEVLYERPQLRVEVAGESSHLPKEFRTHPRVAALQDRPGVEGLSRWAVHLWSPALLVDGIADDPRSLVEVSAVGIPTVLPRPVQAAMAGYPPPGISVDRFDQKEDWIEALRLLLDNEVSWSRQSRAAVRRFDTLNGAAASAGTVNRFLGWALYQGDQR